FLENSEVWGDVAAKQAQRNSAGVEAFDLSRDFSRRFELQTGERESMDAWQAKKMVGDRKKVAAFARGLGGYTNAHDLDQTVRALDARVKLYDTLLEQGDIPQAHVATVTRSRDAARKAQAQLSELQQVKADADLVRRVQSSEGQSVLSQVAGQGAIVGGLIGGIPGAAIGAGIQSLAKPSRVIHQIATLEALSNRLGGVSKQVDTAIQRVTKPVTTGTRPRTGLVPASVLLIGSN